MARNRRPSRAAQQRQQNTRRTPARPTSAPDGIVSQTYEGSGANRTLVTRYSDGRVEGVSAPEAVTNPAPNQGGEVEEEAGSLDPNLQAIIDLIGAQNAQVIRNQEAAAARAEAAEQQRQVNAIENLTRTFELYGLGSLAGKIAEFVKQGYGDDTVALLLQETDEYKQRFSANEARRKAGLPVLSAREYLAAETSYRDILRAAGLPSGFYDSQDDFTKFIAADVSPAEMNQRVAAASVFLENADPVYKNALSQLYNMDSGDMLAYVLDPERALPLVQRRVTAVRVGGAVAREGFQLQQAGIESLLANDDLYTTTDAQMRDMARDARLISNNQQKLAAIENSVFDDRDALDITFGENTNKMLASQQRATRERARFANESGISTASLRNRSGI